MPTLISNFNLTYKGFASEPNLTNSKIVTPIKLSEQITGSGFVITEPLIFPIDGGKKTEIKTPLPRPLSRKPR